MSFILFPLIGAFVGFLTNAIAIKLLFRPKRRVFGIQGLLPKRKAEIARRAGEVVNSYLVNSEAIRRQIDRGKLEETIDRFLTRSNNRVWEMPLLKKIVKKFVLSALLDRDGYFKRDVIESFIDEGMVSAIVERKINEFDLSELEKVVQKASGPELRFIILSGAILGFLIGVAESFITLAKF